MTPHGPDDARELVGDGHCRLVVHVSLRDLVCPLSKAVGALASRVHEDGARAVDEESAQVAITTLGDASQVAFEAAGVLAWRQAEIAGEMAAGRKASNVADEGDECGGDEQPDAGNGAQVHHRG